MQPNSGATPPSHWFRESDKTLLTCSGTAAGEYRFELLGSKIWPGHLGFLLVRAPGTDQPVGYNVHLLDGRGRLLIHAHSYPHRSRERMLDRMEETETVIERLHRLGRPCKLGGRSLQHVLLARCHDGGLRRNGPRRRPADASDLQVTDHPM
jgi:hypothetical protein